MFDDLFTWGSSIPSPVYDRGAVDEMMDAEDEKLRVLWTKIVSFFNSAFICLFLVVVAFGLLVGYAFYTDINAPEPEVPPTLFPTLSGEPFQLGRYTQPDLAYARECTGENIYADGIIAFDDQQIAGVEVEPNEIDGSAEVRTYDYMRGYSTMSILQFEALIWPRAVVTNCGDHVEITPLVENIQVESYEHYTSCYTDIFNIDEKDNGITTLYGWGDTQSWQLYYLDITQVNGSRLNITTTIHGASIDVEVNGQTTRLEGDYRGDILAINLNNGDTALLYNAWQQDGVNMDTYHLVHTENLYYICSK